MQFSKGTFYFSKTVIPLLLIVHFLITVYYFIEPSYLVYTLEAHSAPIRGLYVTDDIILTTSDDKSLKIWDKASYHLLMYRNFTQTTGRIVYNNKTIYLAAGNRVVKMSPEDLKIIGYITHQEGVKDIFVDDQYVYTGSYDGFARIFDKLTQKEIAKLKHPETVWSIVADEDHIYTGSQDAVIRIWDKKSFKLKKLLKGHSQLVIDLFTDDDFLYSGSFDNSVKLWNKSEFKTSETLLGHRHSVWAVYSDQKYIYTGSDDTSIKVWDKKDFSQTHTLGMLYEGFFLLESKDKNYTQGHTDGVKSLFVDNNHIFSASYDSTVKVWKKPPYTTRSLSMRFTLLGTFIMFLTIFLVFYIVRKQTEARHSDEYIEYEEIIIVEEDEEN